VLTQVVLQAIPIFMFVDIPAPQFIKQQIRIIQRNFLWGRGEKKNKWALVAWDKLCKPKSHGGLGLEDPKTISQASGTKLWWHWIKEPRAPWAKLWTQKYARHWQEQDHVRMTGQIRGSHI